MSAFFYWSGLVFWVALLLTIGVLAGALLRELFWAAVYVARLLRACGWREDVPGREKPRRFFVMVWRQFLDPNQHFEIAETGGRIYHPLYRGPR